MQTYVPRIMEKLLLKDLETHPVVAVLGPRQCGKTTLVQRLGEKRESSLYRDLERPRDARQFDDQELFLEANKEHLLILDGIQHLRLCSPYCEVLWIASTDRLLRHTPRETCACFPE
ncbi:MAG: hypothetical protein EA384_03125 [Spirochaetaceae bacterium]|nr:MAG: hypothetical protein EA384_03125 [Spirochaetaceae bacterium]